jgi:asparagine synthetase B (glutamine-hydrolysing)
LIRRHGVTGFLKNADIQGTFQIHDRLSGDTWIFADQINSGGAFYAVWSDKIVAAQEVALVHGIIEMMGGGAEVPINIIRNGCFLKINRAGTTETGELRPQGRLLYTGERFSPRIFEDLLEELRKTIQESVIRRIPRRGPVVVLASGGVDSSIILTIVTSHLRSRRELDRLKVVTFGKSEIGAREICDLSFCLHLLKALHLPCDQHLIVVGEDLSARRKLLLDKVFCPRPRLITPNPILGSQIRHTCRMSLVLAATVRACPDAKVVLTGDVADEIFAGYPTMRRGVQSGSELANRVRQKMDDLPLNDAARYTLASLHGCRSVLSQYESGASADCGSSKSSQDHPLEIRTPFSSHHVLHALQAANPNCLVGSFGGAVMSKLPLRILALRLGAPLEIAARIKVPFNHGGSGLSNDARDPLEIEAAREWNRLTDEELCELIHEERSNLAQLTLAPKDIEPSELLKSSFEQIVVFAAAKHAGLDRLIRGEGFRSKMPDSVYPTISPEALYAPSRMLQYDINHDNVQISSHHE